MCSSEYIAVGGGGGASRTMQVIDFIFRICFVMLVIQITINYIVCIVALNSIAINSG